MSPNKTSRLVLDSDSSGLDFGLVMNEAACVGLSMPATAAAAAINSEEAASGGQEDFSAAIWRIEQ